MWLFGKKMDCQVLQTLGWHRTSSMEICCVFLLLLSLLLFTLEYIATMNFRCGIVKLQNSYMDAEMSPKPLLTLWRKVNGWNSIFGWTIPLYQGTKQVLVESQLKMLCYANFNLTSPAWKVPTLEACLTISDQDLGSSVRHQHCLDMLKNSSWLAWLCIFITYESETRFLSRNKNFARVDVRFTGRINSWLFRIRSVLSLKLHRHHSTFLYDILFFLCSSTSTAIRGHHRIVNTLSNLLSVLT